MEIMVEILGLTKLKNKLYDKYAIAPHTSPQISGLPNIRERLSLIFDSLLRSKIPHIQTNK